MNAEFPWDHEGMIFIEGRYYSGLWNLPIPKFEEFPLGGDILILLWRYDLTPHDWIVTGRVRKNFDEKIFDSEDRKKWFAVRTAGPEDATADGVVHVLTMLAGTIGLTALKSPLDHDVISIKGDCIKAFEILRSSQREWLHAKFDAI